MLLNDNFDVISDCFEDMPHGIERRKYFFDRLSKELETKRSRKGIKKIIAENIINGTKTIGITPKDKESDILQKKLLQIKNIYNTIKLRIY